VYLVLFYAKVYLTKTNIRLGKQDIHIHV
jgi:hypothetical protein